MTEYRELQLKLQSIGLRMWIDRSGKFRWFVVEFNKGIQKGNTFARVADLKQVKELWERNKYADM